MKKFINHILAFIIFIPIGACQQTGKTQNMHTEKFDWQETISCPIGYPVDVYQGALEAADGGTSLYLGTHTGKSGWGHTGRSMSSGIKGVPYKLDVIWLSYAEDTFYHINCPIDRDKMVSLFKAGYMLRVSGGVMNHENYNYIIVGFAPGGVVVIWMAGAGRQVEIGRYQGQKTTVPAKEIARLDCHEHLIFEPEYRRKTMLNEKIVPKEVRAANKGKAIPLGLWDTYRKRYN